MVCSLLLFRVASRTPSYHLFKIADTHRPLLGIGPMRLLSLLDQTVDG